MRVRSSARLRVALSLPFLVAALSARGADTTAPQPRAAVGPAAPADYRSAHFLVHTDLPVKDAKELLDRLETMLALISRYWGRPSVGTIECYVVKDLANWPQGSLEPRGRAKIAEGAGVTQTE